MLEHYIKKSDQKVKFEAKLKEEDKTFEDSITNRYVPPLPSSIKKSEENGEKKFVVLKILNNTIIFML